ncbi:MAG: hypothetical protein ACJ754_05810 [Pyrinomonadaceae bacterium]
MELKRVLKEFPVGNYVALAFGLLLTCGGALLLWLAQPSPHGYIELFFAIPAICFGLLFVSASLLFAYHRLHWALKLLAVILLVAAAYPLVDIARLLWR